VTTPTTVGARLVVTTRTTVGARLVVTTPTTVGARSTVTATTTGSFGVTAASRFAAGFLLGPTTVVDLQRLAVFGRAFRHVQHVCRYDDLRGLPGNRVGKRELRSGETRDCRQAQVHPMHGFLPTFRFLEFGVRLLRLVRLRE
jgi:hypothetical protein